MGVETMMEHSSANFMVADKSSVRERGFARYDRGRTGIAIHRPGISSTSAVRLQLRSPPES
jgi:hypothetical protein